MLHGREVEPLYVELLYAWLLHDPVLSSVWPFTTSLPEGRAR